MSTGLKKEVVRVPNWDGSRDGGKHFLISEMPAAQAEKWAWKLVIAMKGTSGELSPDLEKLGIVGIAIQGINAFLRADVDAEKIEPLLDEMFSCVSMIRDPKAIDQMTGLPVATAIVSDDDILDVKTRFWLRSEVLRVHTGFSAADAVSKLISVIQASPALPTG